MTSSVNVNIGILGHVDSGKTSLVKALSTSLSTAALDKHPQSQQRGITLDLGFSAFSLPVPDHLRDEIDAAVTKIQFTLVDCPGHASLIKTIIGGAQIIDMIILVIDANKGIQTQTAECIVIGEITTDNLIIVLNKVDALPPDEREDRLEKVSSRIRKVFASTKFKDAPIIRTAACIGGEKVAATVTEDSGGGAPTTTTSTSIGIDTLVDHINHTVKVPHRNKDAPFYFAIDHCFPIKGHGTVLTGTVLSGSVSTNSTIELPYIQQQRKVKSMQMFRKSVKMAVQGDRLGICVTNLDATSIERSIAAAPDSVPLLSSAICMVKKVRYFHNICKSNAKYHISVGHATMLATVTFYGAEELRERMKAIGDDESGVFTGSAQSRALSSSFRGNFPRFEYDPDAHYVVQSELVGEADDIEGISEDAAAEEKSSARYGHEPVQWALLQFQQPVYCPIGSLIIGSRLDIDSTSMSSASAADAKWEELNETKNASKSCRLAFHGPVIQDFSRGKMEDVQLFTWKSKEVEVLKITDLRNGTMCHELIAHNLYSEGGSVTPFVGMRLQTASNHVGVITGSYGAGGQFKVKFSSGVPRGRVGTGSKLFLYFKRFLYDKSKSMRQFDRDFDTLVPDTTVDEVGAVEEQEEENTRLKKNTSSSRGKGGNAKAEGKKKELKAVERNGVIESLKEDGQLAIVSGAFTMEEDIRSHAGAPVRLEVVDGAATGSLVGPFAKLGKCKVRFEEKDATIGAGVVVTIQL